MVYIEDEVESIVNIVNKNLYLKFVRTKCKFCCCIKSIVILGKARNLKYCKVNIADEK